MPDTDSGVQQRWPAVPGTTATLPSGPTVKPVSTTGVPTVPRMRVTSSLTLAGSTDSTSPLGPSEAVSHERRILASTTPLLLPR